MTKAGWEIVQDSHGLNQSDAVIVVHYARNGRAQNRPWSWSRRDASDRMMKMVRSSASIPHMKGKRQLAAQHAPPVEGSEQQQDKFAKVSLDMFIAKYTPEVGAVIRSSLARMRARLPGAIELVYDNSYALVIGYSPTERPSEALFSIAAYPRHVSLCFLQGATLADPQGLLEGNGNQVRHIRLESAATLGTSGVRALMTRALAASPKKFDKTRPIRTIVRAVSAQQRPRRPASKVDLPPKGGSHKFKL